MTKVEVLEQRVEVLEGVLEKALDWLDDIYQDYKDQEWISDYSGLEEFIETTKVTLEADSPIQLELEFD